MAELPKIFSDEELDALLKQRRQLERGAHERWDNAGLISKPVPTDGRPESTLEQRFTHIVDKLVALWRSEACAMYLKNLVVADRQEREGFPPDVIEDLLMLYSVNEVTLRYGDRLRKDAPR